MASDASAKAPGKILWLGGYSVLERPNISFVSAVDAYVTADLKIRTDQEVDINAPQLNLSSKGKVDKSTGKISMNVQKELLLLKTAAEISSRYIAGLGHQISGFSITTKSDDAFAYSLSAGKVVKSGLGSSAAVTVATVGAVLKAFGINPSENDTLHKLAQAAHSMATGKVGSGFDIAAASFGSILYTRYSPEIVKDLPANYTNAQLLDLARMKWDYKIEKFSLPNEFRLLFANFEDSMITTKAIGSVSDFKKNDPHTYGDIIGEINEENIKAISALRDMKNGISENALEKFRAAFDRGRIITKKLGLLSNVGIEPDDCTALIEDSIKNGAFVAKLPGAGGKDAISALSINQISQKALYRFWKSKKELRVLKISFTSNGANDFAPG